MGLDRLRLAERSQSHDLLRQVGLRGRRPLLDRLISQPAEQRPPGIVRRGRPRQAQHVPQARIVADRRRQQLLDRGRVQPPLHGPLKRVRQALAAKLTRADELHQRAQAAAVVHNARKRLAEQGRVALRQGDQQCHRHVLHHGALAAVDRQLGQERVVGHLVDERHHCGQLFAGRGVERAIEAARRGELRQGVLRREHVGPAARLVASIGPEQTALQACEQTLVGHDDLLHIKAQRGCYRDVRLTGDVVPAGSWAFS